MYDRIMVPTDIAHPRSMEKAMATSAALAKEFDATITLVGVTVSQPTKVARDPVEYRRKLESYAETQTGAHGVPFAAKAVTSHDPATDLERVLREQRKALDADLVVMASHVPTVGELLRRSNAGNFARHTETSVFVVR